MGTGSGYTQQSIVGMVITLACRQRECTCTRNTRVETAEPYRTIYIENGNGNAGHEYEADGNANLSAPGGTICGGGEIKHIRHGFGATEPCTRCPQQHATYHTMQRWHVDFRVQQRWEGWPELGVYWLPA